MSSAGPLLFPHGRRGGRAGQTPTMLTSLVRGRGLRQSRSRAPRLAAVPHELPCPRWLPQGRPRVRPGGRHAEGGRTPIRAADRRGHQHGHVCRTPSVRTGSFWTRRTVNPLTGPARYNFLYSSSGRPRPATPLPACHQAIGHAHCCTKSRPPVRMLEV